jgi:2-methylcitrate dehydratase PrpD
MRAMRFLEKIDFGVHPEAEAAGFDKMTTIIAVELDDGSVVKGSADFGKGSPANPMSDAELAEKFRQCAAWGRSRSRPGENGTRSCVAHRYARGHRRAYPALAPQARVSAAR